MAASLVGIRDRNWIVRLVAFGFSSDISFVIASAISSSDAMRVRT